MTHSIPTRRSSDLQLSCSAEGHIAYNNNIDTSVVTDVTFTKNVALAGEIRLDGDIDVNSAAVAVVDNKQLLIDNAVTFREESQTGGRTETVDENNQGELNDGEPDTEGGVPDTDYQQRRSFADLDDAKTRKQGG